VRTPDRKFRNQRDFAVTFGLMSEISLGATLSLWSTGGSEALREEAWGRVGSFAVVAATMVLVAVGILALAASTRLSRAALLVAVVATAVGFGALETLAIPAFVQEGVFFPLVTGWVYILPLLHAISRARDVAPRKSRW
jgi:hypothetical protein